MNFRQFSTLLSRKQSTSPQQSQSPTSQEGPTSPPQKDERVYDHLVFLVHGIGEHEEKWKTIVPKLAKCHKKVENYMGVPARVKWIPIEWHSVLHTQTDEHVIKVTPKGMSGPRSFINNTLIDILFWASPYGQTIITEVGLQLNQLYNQFKKEHPEFSGSVSIYAHSLGSIICFDLLSNQPSGTTTQTEGETVISPRVPRKDGGNVAIWERLSSKKAAPAESPILPGEPQLKYPQIEFEVENLFMLGSPTGIFLTARGADYPIRLPKCSNLYNIYNPNDPVAYLIEPLVDPGFITLAPCLVPHIPDTTEQFKGAVARGSKSLFSYYKNTTTTTTTTTSSSSSSPASTTSTVTTSITKEVLPVSPTPASSSNPASPSILAGVVGNLGARNTSAYMAGVVYNQTLDPLSSSSPPCCLQQQISPRSLSPSLHSYHHHPTCLLSKMQPELLEEQQTGTVTGELVGDLITVEEVTVTEAAVLETLGMDTSEPSLTSLSLSSLPASPRLEEKESVDVERGTPERSTSPAAGSAGNNGNGTNGAEKTNVFFEGARYDFKLQPSGIVENLSEYAALINAHRGYWDSKDVMLFVLQKVLVN